jgi:hypothetical protein
MKKEKRSSKQPSVYLPIKIYKSLLKEVEAYKKLQKETGMKWVKVQVNKPCKKLAKRTAHTKKTLS